MKNPLTSIVVTIKFAALWLLLTAALLLPFADSGCHADLGSGQDRHRLGQRRLLDGSDSHLVQWLSGRGVEQYQRRLHRVGRHGEHH